MSEILSITRAVEIRETFVPSADLREGVGLFLDPEMPTSEKESLQAAFLFKSWRRKVLSQANYYTPNGERDQSVRKASQVFEQLPSTSIGFDGNIKLLSPNRGSSVVRLALSPRLTEFARGTINILETIPNDGPETKLEEANLLYVEIAKRSLASQRHQLAESVGLLRHRLTHPGTSRLHTVKAGHIVAKDIMVKLNDLS